MIKIRERKYASGATGLQADIHGVDQEGRRFRKQLQVPPEVTGRAAAQRWAEEQRRRLERCEAPRTPRAAARRERDEAAAAAAAEAARASLPTVAQACAWWVADAEVERLSPVTIELRRRMARALLVPALGDRRLVDLCDEDLAALAARLRECSASYARLVFRCLRGAIKAAARRRADCPTEIRLPQAPPLDEPRAFDPASYEAIVAAAAGLSLQHLAVALLAGEAGLRRGEILGLQVVDAARGADLGVLRVERSRVRVGARMIVKATKTDASRVVPLSIRARRALAELAAERAAAGARPEDWLLVRPRLGGPATESTVRVLVATAERRAGFPEVGPHALRHTGLSHMLAAGVDLRTVQAVAGHRRLETTARVLVCGHRAKQPARMSEPAELKAKYTELDELCRGTAGETIAARCSTREAGECAPRPGSCGACHRAAIELRLRDRPRPASPLLLLVLFGVAALVV